MISKKSAYQIRELVQECITKARAHRDGQAAIRTRTSTLGIHVELSAGERTVGTYIGSSYIEISDKTRLSQFAMEDRNSWGDNTMPQEWWGNGLMPISPCDVSMDRYEESVFQYEVACSGTMPEDSLYGLLVRAIIEDFVTDGICITIQKAALGIYITDPVPIESDHVNDLIDDMHFYKFKRPVKYD